jgi:hypothetical protein
MRPLLSSYAPLSVTAGDPPYQQHDPMPFNDEFALDEYGQPIMNTEVYPLSAPNLWLFYEKYFEMCYPISNHPQFRQLFGTASTTSSQRTIAKDKTLQMDFLPFTAYMYNHDHPAYLKFHTVSARQYFLSFKNEFPDLLVSSPSPAPNIVQPEDPSYSYDPSSDSKLSPSPAPNIVQPEDPSYSYELSSDSQLSPSPAPNIVQPEDPSYSYDLSSDSQLSPSPAPNIDQSIDPPSSCDLSSDSQLSPSPAPNIVQSADTSHLDSLSPDSQLLLPTSPAPNIVSSSDFEDGISTTRLVVLADDLTILFRPTGIKNLSLKDRSGVMPHDFKLPPSPAPNIASSSDLDVSPLISMKDDTEIISVSTSTQVLALTYSSCILLQAFNLLPSPAPNIIGSIQFTNPVNSRSIFPYWEYWENTPSFSYSFDLLSYNAANWLQGILFSIMNQMNCLLFLNDKQGALHSPSSSLSFFFNVFTVVFTVRGDLSSQNPMG